ncbi:septation protein SepH [Enemella sp. A6]|uniref:septation protein SepH n=1 Tax=Enemella sp. A6 TaxID=3440152 RepID=UPI003EC0B7BF
MSRQEVGMESGLTPREIQERIRAGQSLDEVTEVAGMPRDRVERFALAVYDERRHLAEQAREHSVRRTGESGSHRLLGEVVEAWFAEHQVDPETVTWDATRGEDRHFWTVTVRWGADEQLATFGYDVRGTFAVAQDDAAKELIDDDGTMVEPEPEDDPGSSDDEPTLNYADQFAIVNVIQDEDAVDDEDADDDHEDTVSGPFDLQDIVPTPESELDALYAMLRGHQEDSVNIYAGLTDPEPAQPKTRRRRRGRKRDPEAEPPTFEEPTPEQHPAEQPASEQSTAEQSPAEQPTPVGRPAPEQAPAGDLEQPSLLEDDSPAPPPAPAPKRKQRRRAAVPSWDEIMFGGPTKE